tara:strand:+ start:239 stop:712 length:474 start_codon:yes stop_codon:yes gene_type:complete
MTYIPKAPNRYIGNQVILNSDRLIFNAKSDSILLFSDKAIGFSTNGSFHFDTSPDKNTSKFIINSPNIYLGLDFDNTLPKQSAVLGDDLILALNDILDAMEKMYLDMCFNVQYLSGPTGTPTGMNPTNSSIMNKRVRELAIIRDNLEDIKSQNTKLI